VNVTVLNNSLSSRFVENSTIEELVNQLMVEEWNRSIIYENYYNECQPSQCTYTHQTKNSIIYIVTTLVGLIGGLITVLKLIVPRLVKFIRKNKELTRPEIGKL
jgi:beta-lactamase regulating signal transducer with metallopeptidase domain